MEEYKLMMMIWREEKAEFYEIMKELSNIQGKVLCSISAKLLPQLRGKSTVADILLYLNQRYRPSDHARRQQWELVYEDAREINLPHVASSQAQLDFLHAIRPIDLAWATTKLIMIDEAINSSGLVPDLYKLIEQLRHNLKLAEILTPASINAQGESNSSNVFSVSHGEVDNNLGAHKNMTPDGKRVCLCGAHHDFDACLHINFKNRPAPEGWIYRKETFDKINKALSLPYRQKIRKLIEKKFGYNKNSTPPEALSKNPGNSSQNVRSDTKSTLGTFIALHSKKSMEINSSFAVDTNSYHLKDHWVLDGGTDIHVCNNENKHEFTRTSDETDGHKIIAGKTEYPIEAWGSTRVRVLTKEGDAFIVLKRTALVPGFMTNLVSLPLVIEGGVHWSSRSPLRLEKEDGSEFCKLFRSGKHIIFEEEIVSVAKLAKVSLSAN
ncbi:hypothetical protein Golomagni_05800 [Golovinomyces magnicellulatus]|nr:hypothetical protein Golomagni_05800 [Golovinomyces magnicellulatus]